ncbi:MAG: DUF4382 domain-containing protein [Candidatus Eisenbacteria bacterium]|nr:DUF4382 domain-containing protein [Candidatus Eisenbacteria bacterium]
MNFKKRSPGPLAAAVALLAVLNGCGDSSTNVTPDGFGRVTVRITDAPAVDLTDISNLYVTFDRLVVFPEADSIPADTTGDGPERIEILTSPITFDLLSLTNGLSEALGQADLPAGNYRRLVLDLAPDGAWLIEANGDSHDVKVPSGRLIIKTDFTVEDGENTEVLLDFDVAASLRLKQTGNGKYILRPVLRQLPALRDAGSIAGQVLVQTATGLVSAGDILVPNPWRGRPGHNNGNGRRPGDRGNHGRRPDDRAMVPLTVAFPMVVHAHVFGDSDDVGEDHDDDGEDEAVRPGLNPLDHPNDGNDDVHRPRGRGTLVDKDGDYLIARVRKNVEYDLRLLVHPRSGFEVVSAPANILVDGDETGQDFIIRAKPEAP